MVPFYTRLRWVSAKSPDVIERFCQSLGQRIQIYEIVWDGNQWFLWFVPDDRASDIKSGPIKIKEKK